MSLWTVKNMSSYFAMAVFLKLKLIQELSKVDWNMLLEQISTLTTITQQPMPTTDKSTVGEIIGCAGLLASPKMYLSVSPPLHSPSLYPSQSIPPCFLSPLSSPLQPSLFSDWSDGQLAPNSNFQIDPPSRLSLGFDFCTMGPKSNCEFLFDIHTDTVIMEINWLGYE